MKTKEEIEELVLEKFKNKMYNPFFNVAFVEGYTQCQEDMAKDLEYWKGEFEHWYKQAMDMADKKYTEEDLHTILRLRKEWYSHTDKNVVRDFINSLNKQD